mmetsp:Transcript_107895/g.315440  ORF Transcript_107895/g.315440 Transcript_107895/m.315440 type:complete len:211 (-) Transcript_107895:1712-2344(-)
MQEAADRVLWPKSFSNRAYDCIGDNPMCPSQVMHQGQHCTDRAAPGELGVPPQSSIAWRHDAVFMLPVNGGDAEMTARVALEEGCCAQALEGWAHRGRPQQGHVANNLPILLEAGVRVAPQQQLPRAAHGEQGLRPVALKVAPGRGARGQVGAPRGPEEGLLRAHDGLHGLLLGGQPQRVGDVVAHEGSQPLEQLEAQLLRPRRARPLLI